ncbi:hypothetical protein TOPH_02957 [Tolypocladium ophioglossoides CBS 100239]|uniref:Protein kinase domain-containing protein n=1 Tax=Tolypocladium ophioglossoides (strain CBS 100239) TaxID=1163406 RepID=A0A0L0NE31_TOLOC|nr:hypothetical protein TOPH_02957 [Tolypocladium ophioglossoides CBS 100239]
MSWAGGKVEAATAGVPDLAAEVMRSLRPVLAEGVVHDDLRKANMLWNAERRRVMIIDFDRATLLPPARHKKLLRLSEKKRKRKDANLENFVRNHVLRSS